MQSEGELIWKRLNTLPIGLLKAALFCQVGTEDFSLITGIFLSFTYYPLTLQVHMDFAALWMDNGDNCQVPEQILRLRKAHALPITRSIVMRQILKV